MTDREKLIEILSVPIYPKEGADLTEVVADFLLDNDVRPISHASWVTGKNIFDVHCSACGFSALEDEDYPAHSKYCPNCGAKMDEEEE